MGYTRQGLKPCHRPLIAALAEAQMIAGYWLRSGNTGCVNGAAEFLRQIPTSLPSHLRLGKLEHCQLQTLRWRLFTKAAVWGRAQGKPIVKLAIRGAQQRSGWLEILAQLTGPPNDGPKP